MSPYGLNEIEVFFLLVVAATQADTHSRCPVPGWPPNACAPPVWYLRALP